LRKPWPNPYANIQRIQLFVVSTSFATVPSLTDDGKGHIRLR
jgi:hypothetical protein